MNDLTELRPGSERIAARIVRQVTGASIVPRDGVTGRSREHDFDAGHDRVVAFEVTTATDDRRRALETALNDRGSVTPRRAGDSWTVDLRPGASVRRAEADVDGVVSALETEGIDWFACSVWEDPPAGPPSFRRDGQERLGWSEGLRRADELGLQSGWVINRAVDAPVVVLGRPAAGGNDDPAAVVDAVEIEAAANADKLQLSRERGYRERHLFLWIDNTRWDLEFAHHRGDIGRAVAPSVPDAVTHVWVASYRPTPPPGQVAVWRYDRERGWWTVDVDVSVMG